MSKDPEPVEFTNEELNQQEWVIGEMEKLLPETKGF